MRVVLISFSFPEYVLQLASSLSESHEVLLISPADTVSPLVPLLDRKTFDLHLLPRQRLFDPCFARTVAGIMKRLVEFRPDVVHLQSGHPWLCPMLPYLRARYGLVNTVHDPYSHVGEALIHRRITRYLTIKSSHCLIAHGQKMRVETVSRFNVPLRNVFNIPHGNFLLLERLKDANLSEEANSILFFGRILKYKGLDYLIKAEPLITQAIPGAKIIIAGRGALEEHQPVLMSRSAFTVINRYLSPKEAVRLFQKTSLVVLPYIHASQSGVVPLAYTFGVPVVVTDVGSVPEVVVDGVTGRVVPAKDTEALAGAVIAILKDESLRKRMGRKAYEYACNELSWEAIAARTTHVYEQARRK